MVDSVCSRQYLFYLTHPFNLQVLAFGSVLSSITCCIRYLYNVNSLGQYTQLTVVQFCRKGANIRSPFYRDQFSKLGCSKSYEVHLTWGDFTKLIRKSYQNKDNNNVFDDYKIMATLGGGKYIINRHKKAFYITKQGMKQR